jgi:hypothetical protein
MKVTLHPENLFATARFGQTGRDCRAVVKIKLRPNSVAESGLAKRYR